MTTIANAAAFLMQEYGISGVKLQKILYYAQARALTNAATPLFAEEFEAWRLGPVNREVWQGEFVELTPDPQARLTAQEQDLLRATWKVYGHLSPQQLSDLSHADAPWQEARDGLMPAANSDRIISQQAMENFYLARELTQMPDGTWEHVLASPEVWKAAKLRLAVQKRKHGRLTGEARERFIARQVVATQRLEGITVNLSEWHG